MTRPGLGGSGSGGRSSGGRWKYFVIAAVVLGGAAWLWQGGNNGDDNGKSKPTGAKTAAEMSSDERLARIVELEGEVKELKETAQSNRAKLDGIPDLQNAVDRLGREKRGLEDDLRESRASVQAKDREIERLKEAQDEEFKRRRSAVVKEIRDLRGEFPDLFVHVKRFNEGIDNVARDYADELSKRDDLDDELERLSLEHKGIETNYSTHLDALKAKREYAERAADDTQLSQVNGAIAAARKWLESSREEIPHWFSGVRSLARSCERFREELAAARNPDPDPADPPADPADPALAGGGPDPDPADPVPPVPTPVHGTRPGEIGESGLEIVDTSGPAPNPRVDLDAYLSYLAQAVVNSGEVAEKDRKVVLEVFTEAVEWWSSRRRKEGKNDVHIPFLAKEFPTNPPSGGGVAPGKPPISWYDLATFRPNRGKPDELIIVEFPYLTELFSPQRLMVPLQTLEMACRPGKYPGYGQKYSRIAYHSRENLAYLVDPKSDYASTALDKDYAMLCKFAWPLARLRLFSTDYLILSYPEKHLDQLEGRRGLR